MPGTPVVFRAIFQPVRSPVKAADGPRVGLSGLLVVDNRLLAARCQRSRRTQSLAPLVKKVVPSVVNIAVTETVTGGEC